MEESGTKPLDNGDVFKSPNIRSADGEELDVPAKMDGAETATPTVDGIPIAEEDIKFRAENIKKHDDSKMFVKIEGAEKRARQAERDKKKKDEELIKKLHAAASERKKQHRKAKSEKRAAKRRATRQVIHDKIKIIAKFLYRLRFLFLALAIILVGIIVTTNFIIPAINEQKAIEQKANEDKIVAENRTPIIEIYTKVAGKEFSKKELEDLIKKENSSLKIDYMHNSGFILGDNESEKIKFVIKQQNNKIVINKFEYYNYINEERISLTGSSGGYYYLHGDKIETFDDIEELIRKYILDTKGNGTKNEEKGE